MMRRLLNALAAGIGLLILGPFLVPLIIAIVLETRGAPLFLQRRVGKQERPFTCLKLRTMVQTAPNAATHLVDESHVTRVGRLLRKTRLDEVPQLWNVLIGDMNIVGPRPCLPSQTVLIDARRRRGVFAIRPGITGLAQIRGIDRSMPERLARIDAFYVRTRAPCRDLAIVLGTFSRGQGRGRAGVAAPSGGQSPS